VKKVSAALIGLAFFLLSTLFGEVVANVTVQKASVSTLEQSVSGYGMIDFDPAASTVVSIECEAKIAAVSVMSGQRVKKGETLMLLALSEGGKSTLALADISAEYAEKEYDRTMRMKEDALATNADVIAASQNLDKARQYRSELEKKFRPVINGKITALHDGVIQSVGVKSGDIVSPATALVILSSPDALIVSLGIEPSNMNRIRKAQKIHISPLLSNLKPFAASVRSISGQIDPKTRQIMIWAQVPPSVKSIPGSSVKGKIITESFRGIVIPSSAIISRGGKNYCFVVVGKKARLTAVQPAKSVDAHTLIKSGLHEGDMVVITGNYECEDGISVVVKEQQ